MVALGLLDTPWPRPTADYVYRGGDRETWAATLSEVGLPADRARAMLRFCDDLAALDDAGLPLSMDAEAERRLWFRVGYDAFVAGSYTYPYGEGTIGGVAEQSSTYACPGLASRWLSVQRGHRSPGETPHRTFEARQAWPDQAVVAAAAEEACASLPAEPDALGLVTASQRAAQRADVPEEHVFAWLYETCRTRVS